MKQCLIMLWCVLAFPLANAANCDIAPLDILLTNDDGYNTPAIKALHRALAKAGHRVKRIAPDKNYSGSSASITLSKITAAQTPDGGFDQVYAVSGSPATTVLLGASALFKIGELDLVISGINEGANLGPGTVMSGTVGATTAAAHALQPSVAALAVSTDLIVKEPGAAENLVLYEQISDFVVTMVEQLQKRSCENNNRLLPEKMALNVNYPPLQQSEIKGVKLAKQGQKMYVSIGYTPIGDGTYGPALKPLAPSQDIKNGDTRLFNEGYITIVPLDGDMSVKPVGTLQQLEKLPY